MSIWSAWEQRIAARKKQKALRKAQRAEQAMPHARALVNIGKETGRLKNIQYRELAQWIKTTTLAYEDFGITKGTANDWNARWLGETGNSPLSA